jgi:hypothetical protein
VSKKTKALNNLRRSTRDQGDPGRAIYVEDNEKNREMMRLGRQAGKSFAEFCSDESVPPNVVKGTTDRSY